MDASAFCLQKGRDCAIIRAIKRGVLTMQCGISTSCFYPQETAEALSALRGAGVETVEIFLNTFSELELCLGRSACGRSFRMRACAPPLCTPLRRGWKHFSSLLNTAAGWRTACVSIGVILRYAVCWESHAWCSTAITGRRRFRFKGIAKIICCCAGQRGNMALISVRKTWCAANAACRNMCVKCGNIRGTHALHLFWM